MIAIRSLAVAGVGAFAIADSAASAAAAAADVGRTTLLLLPKNPGTSHPQSQLVGNGAKSIFRAVALWIRRYIVARVSPLTLYL